MNIGQAVAALKAGLRVSRKGWNGKGMFLLLVPGGPLYIAGCPIADCIGMKTANGTVQPGWLASQADLLAEDWVIVEK